MAAKRTPLGHKGLGFATVGVKPIGGKAPGGKRVLGRQVDRDGNRRAAGLRREGDTHIDYARAEARDLQTFSGRRAFPAGVSDYKPQFNPKSGDRTWGSWLK